MLVSEQLGREVVVQRLLDDLCVTLGFCLPPDEQRKLRERPPADATDLADAVLEAEGLDPDVDVDLRLRRQLRDRVARHMRVWDSERPSKGVRDPPAWSAVAAVDRCEAIETHEGRFMAQDPGLRAVERTPVSKQADLKASSPAKAVCIRWSWAGLCCGQGRGRTADLPIFRWRPWMTAVVARC